MESTLFTLDDTVHRYTNKWKVQTSAVLPESGAEDEPLPAAFLVQGGAKAGQADREPIAPAAEAQRLDHQTLDAGATAEP